MSDRKKETHDVGSITESIVISELKMLGLSVSIPFGRPRYDVVVDDGKTLYKVQVKTGNYKPEEGVVVFKCRSVHTNSKGNKSMEYTREDIDAFVVHSDGLDESYWVPVEESGSSKMHLRVDDAKIDAPDINWASDYLLSDMFGK
jgi:hypothetical protein